MWEYEILNINTNKTEIIFGHSVDDALKNHPEYRTSEWKLIRSDYID